MIKEFIQDLIDSGLSQKEIERRTGVSQPNISRLLSGRHADMKYAAARSIENLHKKVCGKKRRVISQVS